MHTDDEVMIVRTAFFCVLTTLSHYNELHVQWSCCARGADSSSSASTSSTPRKVLAGCMWHSSLCSTCKASGILSSSWRSVLVHLLTPFISICVSCNVFLIMWCYFFLCMPEQHSVAVVVQVFRLGSSWPHTRLAHSSKIITITAPTPLRHAVTHTAALVITALREFILTLGLHQCRITWEWQWTWHSQRQCFMYWAAQWHSSGQQRERH